MVNSGIGFTTLWVAWGIVGIVASVVLGATVIRRTGEALSNALQAQTDRRSVVALQRRLRAFNVVNLALLFSVVWAMVAESTL